jgi:cell fate regulator YaaT (PSP1 superfamily)
MHAHDWLNVIDIERPDVDFGVYEIAFKAGRRAFYQNVNNLELNLGDEVIIEADRGIDYGRINLSGDLVRLRLKAKKQDESFEFPKIMRKATLEDMERLEKTHERETNSFAACREMIERHGLQMRLIDVEWQFDGNKVTFYFTADKRIDFRKLVRELAAKLSTRIEMRQVGARDAAARVGGLGACGRELCCSTWLQEFKPVNTNAAKAQNLPLNLTRLSGQCGRLKCCLNYELDQYMEALGDFPDLGIRLEINGERCYVSKLDIFKQLVWVEFEGGRFDPKPLAEVRAILKMDTPEGRMKSRRRVFENMSRHEEDELAHLDD